MGFLRKVKKVLPFIERGAVIAAQAAAGNPIGASLAVVELIQSRGQKEIQAAKEPEDVIAASENANRDATKAVAVGLDDHEERIVEMEADVKALLRANVNLNHEIDELKQGKA